MLDYCGTLARSFVHSGDIEHLRYVHLNELMSGRVGDVNPAVHLGNYGHAFVGGLVSNDLVVNPDHVPHLDVLTALISTRLGNIPAPLRRFFEASYDDEQIIRRPADLDVQLMTANQRL